MTDNTTTNNPEPINPEDYFFTTKYPAQKYYRLESKCEYSPRYNGYYASVTVYRRNKSKKLGHVSRFYGFGKTHKEAIDEAMYQLYGWFEEWNTLSIEKGLSET
jgi:hypothetical protein